MAINSVGGGNAGTVLGHALDGLHKATERAARDAGSIAQGKLDPATIVDLKSAEIDFKASAAVARTADEMEKTLLDITA